MVDERTVRASWTEDGADEHTKETPTERETVQHSPDQRRACGSTTSALLRWLVDDGVPVNMVQVMGHERSTTTPDLHTRLTDGHDRILRALGEDDDGDGPAGPLVPLGRLTSATDDERPGRRSARR